MTVSRTIKHKIYHYRENISVTNNFNLDGSYIIWHSTLEFLSWIFPSLINTFNCYKWKHLLEKKTLCIKLMLIIEKCKYTKAEKSNKQK